MNTSKHLTKIFFSLAMAMLLSLGSLPTAASAQTRTYRNRRAVYNTHTVRANTVIRARMNQELSSEKAQVGERFTSLVTDPVFVGRTEVIPRGSTIYGQVDSVTKAQRGGKPGTLGVSFYSLELPNGVTRAINGSLISSEELKKVDNEGQIEGRGAVTRNSIFIGAGAGTGAVIGAIAGGGKGAVIGSIIGAGLGTGSALLTKGQQARVKEGTDFGVILNRNVVLTAY